MRPPQRRRDGWPRMRAPRRERALGRSSGCGRGRGICAGPEGSRVAPPGLSETLWRGRGSRTQRTLGRHCPLCGGPRPLQTLAPPSPRPRPPLLPLRRSRSQRLRPTRPAEPGPTHRPLAPPTAGFSRFRRSVDSAQLPGGATPSPASGPASPPGADSLLGDPDRRAAPGTELARTAAEPAGPLKGASSLGNARFPLFRALLSLVACREGSVSLSSPPRMPRPQIPSDVGDRGWKGWGNHSIRRCTGTPPPLQPGEAQIHLTGIRRRLGRHVLHAADPGVGSSDASCRPRPPEINPGTAKPAGSPATEAPSSMGVGEAEQDPPGMTPTNSAWAWPPLSC